MRAPDFWQRGRGGWRAAALAPVAAVWTVGARWRRARGRPWRAPVPVLCVGNLVAGGAGKTPVALDLGARLAARGIAVHFLTRGYGGRTRGPRRVDPARDDFVAVGDEALLLARVAPAWVGRDRVALARAALAAGAEALILDDGFQDPSLAHDCGLVVVDGAVGFGNGRTIPAGPLREPIADGLARAHAAVLIGDDAAGARSAIAGIAPVLPIVRARVVPAAGSERLLGQAVVAFAGIGRPEKFFATVRALGATVRAARAFADHHPYADSDLAALAGEAQAHGARLVTTAKDAMRLPPAFRERVEVLTIALRWEDEAALDSVLKPLVRR